MSGLGVLCVLFALMLFFVQFFVGKELFFGVIIFFVEFIIAEKSFRSEKLGFSGVKKRMVCYARLKGATKKTRSAVSYEVLLGMLKKVETKASSLLVVWSIISAGLVSIVAGLEDHAKFAIFNFDLQIEKILFCLLLGTTPVFYSLLRCFKQLDNSNFSSYGEISANRLLGDLIRDLDIKEKSHRFVHWVSYFYVVLITIIVLAVVFQSS